MSKKNTRMSQYRGQDLNELHEIATKLYEEGNSLKEIGMAVDRTSRCMRRWRTKLKWKRNSKIGDYVHMEGYIRKRKLAKKYHKEGYWPKKIASQLEISLSSVYRWRKIDGWDE